MATRNLALGVKAGFLRSVVGTVVDTTTASARNATYVDSAVTFGNNASGIFDFTDDTGVSASAVAGETLSVRLDAQGSSGTGVHDVFILLNASDQMLIRLRQMSGTSVQLMYNSGTLASPTWTNLGAAWAKVSGALVTYNLELVIDAGGNHTAKMYMGGVEVLSPTSFSMPLLTSVDAIRLGGIASGQQVNLSQLFCATDTNLVGSFVPSLKATADGAHTAWTGTYTDVNEAVGSDTTLISSATSGQKESFAMSDVVVPSGTTIQGAVRHTFRARNSGVTPSNIKPLIREGGVDTVGSDVSGLAVSYGTFVVPYVKTAAEINDPGFELGWESST